jgi:hypothetical protein
MYLTLSFIIIQSCSDKITEPVPEVIYGVDGNVIDTACIPIGGVEVYCLFNY